MKLEKYLSKNAKKHIIFDLDETLLTLHIDWSRFRLDIRQEVALFDKAIIKQIPNKSGSGVVVYNQAIIKHGAKARKVIIDFCKNYELNNLDGFTINKSLVDFIKENSNKYNLYIWSSNNRKTVIPIVKKVKIFSHIKKIVTKEEVDLLKPYPDGFYLIYDYVNQQRKDYLMVGDSSHDKFAAKAAGIDFLRIKNQLSE